MRQFGLIGYPLSHSFSPAFFGEKFIKENISDCRYDAFPLAAIEELKDLINSYPNLEGLNVTIPYKKEVLPYLDHASDAIKKLGACNCIRIIDGKLTGHNTDIVGFEKSLTPLLKPVHIKALILGTGGGAAAVAYVLEKLSIEYLQVSRNRSENTGVITYKDLNEEILQTHLLLINTSPVGMYPAVDEFPDLPYHYLTADHYLYDLIYNPGETIFLTKGKERGATIKNGSDMLIIQAEASWKIWNEKR